MSIAVTIPGVRAWPSCALRVAAGAPSDARGDLGVEHFERDLALDRELHRAVHDPGRPAADHRLDAVAIDLRKRRRLRGLRCGSGYGLGVVHERRACRRNIPTTAAGERLPMLFLLSRADPLRGVSALSIAVARLSSA